VRNTLGSKSLGGVSEKGEKGQLALYGIKMPCSSGGNEDIWHVYKAGETGGMGDDPLRRDKSGF